MLLLPGNHEGVILEHPALGGGTSKRQKSKAGEDAYNSAFCALVGGRTEVRHYYNYPGGRGYVIVDCETAIHVYEGGLDKRSSLDSVQQALIHVEIGIKKAIISVRDGRKYAP